MPGKRRRFAVSTDIAQYWRLHEVPGRRLTSAVDRGRSRAATTPEVSEPPRCRQGVDDGEFGRRHRVTEPTVRASLRSTACRRTLRESAYDVHETTICISSGRFAGVSRLRDQCGGAGRDAASPSQLSSTRSATTLGGTAVPSGSNGQLVDLLTMPSSAAHPQAASGRCSAGKSMPSSSEVSRMVMTYAGGQKTLGLKIPECAPESTTRASRQQRTAQRSIIFGWRCVDARSDRRRRRRQHRCWRPIFCRKAGERPRRDRCHSTSRAVRHRDQIQAREARSNES